MLEKGEEKNKRQVSPDVFDINDSAKSHDFNHDFNFDKNEYISLADVAKYTKFSQDYISLLARNQKIPAKKFGRNWKVKMVDVESYVARVEAKSKRVQVKEGWQDASVSEKKMARLLNVFSSSKKDDNFLNSGKQLTNFARHKFQTVMASFLIIAIVAWSSFFWLAPAYASKLDDKFDIVKAKVTEEIKQAKNYTVEKIKDATQITLSYSDKVLQNGEKILHSSDDDLTLQLKKAGVKAIFGFKKIGEVASSGMDNLETRANKRQMYILDSIGKSAKDAIKQTELLSADLQRMARQIIIAPTKIIPAPIKYSISEGINLSSQVIAGGADVLNNSKNNLVRQDAGMVAGVTEKFEEEKDSFGSKILGLFNSVAQRQKKLANATKQQSNDGLKGFSDQQRNIGLALLNKTKQAVDKVKQYTNQKINSSKSMVLGTQETATNAGNEIWKNIDNGLATIGQGIDSSLDVYKTVAEEESARTQRSVATVTAKFFDLLMPDALKSKLALLYQYDENEQATQPVVIAATQAEDVATNSDVINNNITQVVQSNASVPSELEINKLTVEDIAYFKAKINVDGPASFNSYIYSEKGSVTVQDDLLITGSVWGDSLTIDGNTSLTNLTVADSAKVGGHLTAQSLTVNSNASVNGTLSVSGLGMFNSLSSSYDLSAGRNLGAGGNLSVGKSAYVTEKLTIGDDLQVDKNGDITGTLAVGGDVSVSGGISVSGDTTMSGSATVVGDLSVTGNVDVGSLSGNISLSGATEINASSSSPVLLVNQQGTGNIFKLQDDAIDVFAVVDGGQVGIGTSSPDSQLTLWSSLATSSTASIFNIIDNASTTLLTVLNQGEMGIQDVSPDFGLEIAASTTNGYFAVSAGASGDGDLFIINGSGYVGIGTTSPSITFAIDATDAMLIPVGTTAQRPGSGYAGMLRYNTTDSTFEGYDGSNWSGLGGVIDVDRDTYIIAESGSGTDEDQLYFYTSGSFNMVLNNKGQLGIGTSSPSALLSLSTSTTPQLRIAYDDTLYSDIYTDSGGNLNLQSVSGDIYVRNNLVPVPGSTNSIGSDTNYWKHGYFDELTVNTLGIASTTVLGTLTSSFTINSDATGDEDSSLIFYRGGTLGDATLNWVAANDRFEFGSSSNAYELYTYGNLIVATTTATSTFAFDIASASGDFTIHSAGTTNNLLLNPYGGNVGIGTTSPFTKLSVAGNGYFSGNLTSAGTMSVIGLSTFTNSSTTQATIGNMYLRSNTISATNDSGLYLYDNASNGIYIKDGGDIGIGTANPDSPFNFISTQNGGSSNTFAFNIEPNFTGTPSSGTYIGERVAVAIDATGSPSAEYRGLSLEANVNQEQDNVVSYSGSITGAQFDSLIYGNNVTAASLYGAKFRAGNVGSATVTDAYAGQFEVLKLAGSIENAYGIYINDVSQGSTNNYAIYSAGGDSYFADNVGIGDTSPTYKLDVNGNARFTSYVDASYFTATSTTATSTFAFDIASASGDFTIHSAGTTNNLLLNPYGGNVGIGTTSPSSRLTIDSNSNSQAIKIYGADSDIQQGDIYVDANGAIYLDVRGGNDNAQFVGVRSKDDQFGFLGYESDGTGTNAYWNMYVTDGTPDVLSITVTSATDGDALNITSDNNVGIGTNSPNGKLEVQTAVRTTAFSAGDSSTWADLIVRNPKPYTDGVSSYATGIDLRTSEYTGVNAGVGIAAVKSATSDVHADLVFITRPNAAASEERMRITNTGNVGIGTVSPGTSLHINNAVAFSTDYNSAGDSLYISDTGGTTGLNAYGASIGFGSVNWEPLARGAAIATVQTNSDNNEVGLAFFTHPSASGSNPIVEKMRITDEGNVGIGTTTPWGHLSVTGAGTLPSFVIEDQSDNTDFVVLGNGNVGIGTTSPEEKLDIGSGHVIFDNTYGLKFQNSIGDVAGRMKVNSAGRLVIDNGANDQITINTNNDIWLAKNGGNVGIGLTSPTYALDIASSTGTNLFRVGTSTTNTMFEVQSNQIIANVPLNLDTSGDVQFGSDLVFTDNISASILSNSPLYITAGDASQNVDLVLSANNLGQVVVDDQLKITGDGTSNDILTIASSTGTSLVTVTAGGEVGIGTTTSVWGNTRLTIKQKNGQSYERGIMVLSSNGIEDGFIAMGVADTDVGSIQTGDNIEYKNLALQPYGGNVGIGDTSPDRRLTVFTGATADAQLRLGYDDTYYWDIGREQVTTGRLMFINKNGGGVSEFMSILPSGNVGIGTVSPVHKLEIAGDIIATGALSNYVGTGAYIYDDGTYATLSGYTTGGSVRPLKIQGSPIVFYADSPYAEKMRINTDGNVGIGISDPSYALDIAKDTTDLFRVGTSTTNTMFEVQNTQITANVPLNLDTAGDVQFGSDLEFTDNISASILSNSPLYLTAGNAGQNVSLYLKGQGTGKVVVDDGLYVASTTGIRTEQTTWAFAVDHDGDGDATYAYVNASNAWAAGSADYAEYYWTEDTDLESGEAVCIDVTQENSVKRCTRGSDGNLMGIVSTNPAFLGNAPGEERRENNPNYVIVGMLGQVPAKVSAENGEIRPGDALTSASSTPGYVMKAGAGDPTVGVALEALASAQIGTDLDTDEHGYATGKINVLISRRNKSLTVEEVESTVLERIASMEIEDEVQIMVQNTVDDYNFDPVVTEIIGGELAVLSDSFDSQLTVQQNELTDLINSSSATFDTKLSAITATVNENGVMIATLQGQVTSLENVLDGLTSATTTTTVLEPMNIIVNNASSSALSVAQLGDGNIAEFKSASSTVLAIITEERSNLYGERDWISPSRVVIADNTALAFGDEENIIMAYNSDEHRMEVITSDEDLYISLGAGKMIVAGISEVAEGQDFASLQVENANTEISTHASSTATALTVQQNGSGDIIEFRNATVAVMTIAGDGDVEITGGNLEVCVGACPDTESFTPTSEGDLGVEASVFAQDYRVHCPEGWVEVPRDNKHTFQNFCVMKAEYNANMHELDTNINELPLTNVTLAEARNYCKSLGEGSHLVTDAEWMTLAENIAGLPINDIDEASGLQLSTGNSNSAEVNNISTSTLNIDACSLYVNLADAENDLSETCQLRGENRVAVLSNGQVIWDIAGNVSEWTDNLVIASEQPTDATPASKWLEYGEITKYANMSYIRPSGYDWTSANGIGKIYTDYDAGDATRGSVRGGSYNSGERAGVFGLDLSYAPGDVSDEVGFRCAR